MDTPLISWLLLALLFLIFEMGSPGLFYFLSFSWGALVAGLSSLIWGSFVVQGLFFLGATCSALLLLKAWVTKKSSKNHAHMQSNMYALQGKRARVVAAIAPLQPGTVKIGGEVWTAYAAHDIPAGNHVVVIAVRGAHVVVEEIK